MVNVLGADKQRTIIASLCEGCSIRLIERITGVHRDTIMRLGVRVGRGYTALMDATMRDLPCSRLEMDEIWGFIGKKQKQVRIDDDPSMGDVWTFCAIDSDTKLVPAFMVGKHDKGTPNAFVADVASRMKNRVQISTDGLSTYMDAISGAFGNDVDFAQIIKTYGHEEVSNNRRYSASEFVSSEKRVICGNLGADLISTSYVERLNATTRLHMCRLTRLTLGFSKKLDNFEAAVGLRFAYYNFVKRHNTLKCTPAMAAGLLLTISAWLTCWPRHDIHRRIARCNPTPSRRGIYSRFQRSSKRNFQGSHGVEGVVEVFDLIGHPTARDYTHGRTIPIVPRTHGDT